MRDRIAARVLLLDPEDRLLLMRGRLPNARNAPWVWFTVGGELEPGETERQAAAREVAEETGFTDVEIGPVVWRHEGVLTGLENQPVRVRESFVLARCAGGEPSRDGWTDIERAMCDDLRWWTLAELAASRETIYPLDLAALLTELLVGGPPALPREIRWG
jgi:8-oxo-dGTP diphosphatase